MTLRVSSSVEERPGSFWVADVERNKMQQAEQNRPSAETANLCVIYCRISRDALKEGIGVERQEKDCRELAQRLGFEVVHVFTDNDIGASEKTNPRKIRHQYLEMLDRARAGEFGRILAYSNSRITRRPLELEGLIKLYEQTGVVIHTVVSGDDDLSTADGRMVARIKAAVDAAEAERISERAKNAHRHKAMEGTLKRSPWRAFGFQQDGVTHHPTEARLIQEAVRKVIAGASIRQIGKAWEEQGITSTRGTTYWGHSRVKDALFSWKVAGIRAYNGEPVYDAAGELVKGNWEPIISLEDRAKALAELETHYAKPKRRDGKWLLSGLIYCGKCGRPMYGALGNDERRSTYVCSNGRTAHLGIRASLLEWWVQRVVFRYVLNRSIIGAPEPEPLPEPEEWPQEAELASVKRRIKELMAAYHAEELSSSVVFPQVNELEGERKTLERERELFYANQRPASVPMFPDRQAAWKSLRDMERAPFEERRLILRQELSALAIKPGKRGARGLNALRARLDFGWKEPHYRYNDMSAEELAALPDLPIFRSPEYMEKRRRSWSARLDARRKQEAEMEEAS